MSIEALQRAVDLAKGQSALAAKLGVTQSTVWYWLKHSKKGVPAEYVIPIETAFGVSRHDLRSDLYPRQVAVDPAHLTTAETEVAA